MRAERIFIAAAAISAVFAGMAAAAPSARAEFYWEGLLPFVRHDVELTVRGMECGRNCPRQGPGKEETRPPPLPGEGALDWLIGPDGGAARDKRSR